MGKYAEQIAAFENRRGALVAELEKMIDAAAE